MKTSEPYQPTLFEETELPLTQSVAASPVRTLALLESALALKVKGLVCGESTGESSLRYDPAGQSWRTSQACLVSGWEPFSETFPRSGMMLSGTVSQLPPSAPLTGGTGFGSSPTHSIPTPTTQDHIERRSTSSEKLNPATNKSVSLDRFVKYWPTPRANDAEKRGEIANDQRNGLPAAVKYWPTARSSDWKGAVTATECTARRVESGQANLPEAVVESLRMWPTPTTQDWKDGSAQACQNVPANGLLGRVVHQFATPQARDYRTGQIERWENSERSRNLNDQIGGSLSADWVEALMGFPIGWTFISEKQ